MHRCGILFWYRRSCAFNY